MNVSTRITGCLLCCLTPLNFVAQAYGAAGEPLAADDPNRGLIAHYPFDKDTNDAVGKHHGENHGGAAVADGRIGGAWAFDGRAGYVRLPARLTAGLGQFTFALWVKTQQSAGRPREEFWRNPTILGFATSGPASGDFGVFTENGRAACYHGLGDEGRDTCLFTDKPIHDGEWHQLALTHNGVSVLFYVDGRLAGGELFEHSGRLTPLGRGNATAAGGTLTDTSVFVGACNDTSQPAAAEHFFAGAVDHLRVWNRALSPRDVAALWTQVTGRTVDVVEPILPASAGDGAADAPVEKTITLCNQAGLRWAWEQRRGRWTLGTLALYDRPVDAPLAAGMFGLRNLATRQTVWLPAAEGQPVDERTARFSGSEKIGDVTLRFAIDVSLAADQPAARLTPRWSVDRKLDGFEVCFAYHGRPGRAHVAPPLRDGERVSERLAHVEESVAPGAWRCTLYPFAGNATTIRRSPLTYVGVPAALMFRDDLSLVALFGLDPASDYLNPTTWTGTTGFYFAQGRTPPQFTAGGGKLSPGTDYALPLQVLLSDAGNSADAITALVRNWVKLNQYQVQPLSVRTPQAAFDLFLEGRRTSKMWRPGLGYQIMENWKVVYTAEQPINAWFDYLLYEQSGDPLWRERAFQTMDFMLGAQHTDPADLHFGAIETNYELDTKRFTSRDHSPNWHYKVDMNAYAARYMLLLWRRVKEKEKTDKQAWYQAAVRIADWLVRQQNPDGGLPQVVADDPAKKSISVVSGRALVALPIIHEITGDARYARLAADMERFLRTEVEGRYWFTGAHVDLWPKDFEGDSVWQAAEYWLDKYDRTQDKECLRRAQADAWFAFLMWCPKQLPWVKNPTQTCHTEQENYRQYSNYCYNNRKYYCLDRLAKLTGEPLFGQLRDRIMQCGFWGQATQGDWRGGQYERMSDPWQNVSRDVDSLGQIYVSELALEANLQLLEMGLARPRRE